MVDVIDPKNDSDQSSKRSIWRLCRPVVLTGIGIATYVACADAGPVPAITAVAGLVGVAHAALPSPPRS
jgi:hypothetical protein